MIKIYINITKTFEPTQVWKKQRKFDSTRKKLKTMSEILGRHLLMVLGKSNPTDGQECTNKFSWCTSSHKMHKLKIRDAQTHRWVLLCACLCVSCVWWRLNTTRYAKWPCHSYDRVNNWATILSIQWWPSCGCHAVLLVDVWQCCYWLCDRPVTMWQHCQFSNWVPILWQNCPLMCDRAVDWGTALSTVCQHC
jgi:hypothetical protein